VDLVTNVIGSFSGGKALGVDADGLYVLNIDADGTWSVTVEQPVPTTAPRTPQTLAGNAQDYSGFFTLASGLATFRLDHAGSSNFAVILLDKRGEWVDLLVNEIGDFSGGKAIGVDASGIYLLDVEADGPWRIAVDQPTPSSAPSPPQTYTGDGQEYSAFFTLSAGTASFHLEHAGTSNFAVVLLDDRGRWVDLLVNEIGSCSGSEAVEIDTRGIYLLDILADGNWTITVGQ
jgi:hypothetical protein